MYRDNTPDSVLRSNDNNELMSGYINDDSTKSIPETTEESNDSSIRV
jgi:hypothetical protein